MSRGEVVGFLGPNGAGKSTTMKMLTGFLEPDAGTASISFVAIVPGRYTLSIPGSSGETQQAVFNIQ